jgi:hypothetical protein
MESSFLTALQRHRSSGGTDRRGDHYAQRKKRCDEALPLCFDCRNLEANAAVSPKDVFIFMHENDYSDWSVGNDVFVMAMAQQRGTDG